MSSYSPKSYRAYASRRRTDSFAVAVRKAQRGRQSIATAIEQNGERMSEEGKAMLTGLTATLKDMERAMR